MRIQNPVKHLEKTTDIFVKSSIIDILLGSECVSEVTIKDIRSKINLSQSNVKFLYPLKTGGIKWNIELKCVNFISEYYTDNFGNKRLSFQTDHK